MRKGLARYVALVLLLAATAVSADQIKIGVIAPLSGPLAEYGVALKNGLALAQEKQPEATANCSFIFEDSRYEPKTAVSAIRKLADIDKVRVVLNWGAAPSEAVAPVAQSIRMPLLVWSSDPQIVKGRSFVLRFSNSGKDYGEQLVSFLQGQGFSKLGIVRAENQYIDSILEGVRASLGAGQSLEVVDSYSPADQDFRSTVSKIRTAGFDAVGVFLLSGQVSQFYRQLRQQQISVPTFGTDTFESLTEIRAAEGGMNGGVYPNNRVSERFLNDYLAKYGNDLQITHAGSGYDFAVHTCSALSKYSQELSPENVIQALTADTSEREGVQGKYRFVQTPDGDHYFRFPVVVKKIEGERIFEVLD